MNAREFLGGPLVGDGEEVPRHGGGLVLGLLGPPRMPEAFTHVSSCLSQVYCCRKSMMQTANHQLFSSLMPTRSEVLLSLPPKSNRHSHTETQRGIREGGREQGDERGLPAAMARGTAAPAAARSRGGEGFGGGGEIERRLGFG